MEDLYFINQRKNQANNSTIGDIYERVNKETGELKWFAHIPEDDKSGPKGDARMPEGVYPLKIHPTETPKTIIFRDGVNGHPGSMPYLERFIEMMDTQTPPRFGLVFFHVLNNAAETEGCQGPNDNMNNNNNGPAQGSGSSSATKRFYDKVYAHLKAGGKAWYEIRDEYRLWKK